MSNECLSNNKKSDIFVMDYEIISMSKEYITLTFISPVGIRYNFLLSKQSSHSHVKSITERLSSDLQFVGSH